MIKFEKVEELLAHCRELDVSIMEVMIRQEMDLMETSREDILADMSDKVDVMLRSVAKGKAGVVSHSGITGGDAKKLQEYIDSGKGLTGDLFLNAVSSAIAVNEVNAAMGIICATPTAGSAGIVPGVLMALSKKYNWNKEKQIEFLLTAGAFGMCIGNQAPIAGASGGCQAEVGSASGMAAAAITACCGGTAEMAAEALAIALKNILGLVCDPVAGLVEVPCIKRNAMGVANALAAAEMALAGITSHIPADQVILAMGRIGQIMPSTLRETATGGLAVTPAGQAIAAKVKMRNQEIVKEEEE